MSTNSLREIPIHVKSLRKKSEELLKSAQIPKAMHTHSSREIQIHVKITWKRSKELLKPALILKVMNKHSQKEIPSHVKSKSQRKWKQLVSAGQFKSAQTEKDKSTNFLREILALVQIGWMSQVLNLSTALMLKAKHTSFTMDNPIHVLLLTLSSSKTLQLPTRLRLQATSLRSEHLLPQLHWLFMALDNGVKNKQLKTISLECDQINHFVQPKKYVLLEQ